VKKKVEEGGAWDGGIEGRKMKWKGGGGGVVRGKEGALEQRRGGRRGWLGESREVGELGKIRGEGSGEEGRVVKEKCIALKSFLFE